MVRNADGSVKQGSLARVEPEGKVMRMWEAIETYMERKQPLIIVAGADYGQGSSRDWAAKGVRLAGVEAIVAEGFERIHRTNLIGMGVLPLQFEDGQDRRNLKLTGKEVLNIRGLGGELKPHMPLSVEVTREDGSQDSFKVLCRIDTLNEVEYFKAGGILHYVLRSML